MHGRYVTDILKVCMKKFIAEKFVAKFYRVLICTLRGVYCKSCLQPIACWSRFFMSYFLSYCKLFICKLKQIDYLV